MRAVLRAALVAAALPACSWTAPRDIAGLPCDDAGACAGGYVCDRGSTTCIAESDCIDADLDGFCAGSDCDDAAAACGTEESCADADADGLRACGGDLDDANPHCGRDPTDADQDGWCADQDCDEQNPHCGAVGCVDADADGWCADFDCDDGANACQASCIDEDADGLALCAGDCDDLVASCRLDCATNTDNDALPDCADGCVDRDGDGVGSGVNDNRGCAAGALVDSDDSRQARCGDSDGDGCDDCASVGFDPANDGLDSDADGLCDLGDSCTDVDGDLVGSGGNGNSGCAVGAVDVDDRAAAVCTDSDGDGCDDCASGSWAPGIDGPDADGDGSCDSGDANAQDPSLCSDVDGDGCDDCTSGRFEPSADGLDADADGFCAVGDCDDGSALCTAGAGCTTDADRDGTPLCADCNDLIPTCAADCTANADGDVTATCIELACGSNPSVADSCLVADGTTLSLEQAVSAANAAPGFDHLLVTYAVTFDSQNGTPARPSTQVLGGSTCMSIRSLQPLAVADAISAFVANAPGCIFDGLVLTGGWDVLDLRGDNAVVRGCDISAWVDGGAIRIDGGNVRVEHCFLHDGNAWEGNDVAAIVLSTNATGVRIVDNVISNNRSDAIQLRDGVSDIAIDHNTLAYNADGIEVSGRSSSAICMRNNLIAENIGSALMFSNSVSWEVAACAAPLANGPVYGNADFANQGGSCSGGNCSLPNGTFWQFNADPLFDINAPVDRLARYCLGEPAYVDAGAALGWDLNGDQPGLSNGAADIGAMEAGAPPCLTP